MPEIEIIVVSYSRI